jgi:hypothetical protein
LYPTPGNEYLQLSYFLLILSNKKENITFMWSSGVQHVLFVTITGDIFFFLTTYTKTVSMIFFFLLQMYTLLSGYWKYFFQKEEYNVLILGLDNAGKTVSVPTGRK